MGENISLLKVTARAKLLKKYPLMAKDIEAIFQCTCGQEIIRYYDLPEIVDVIHPICMDGCKTMREFSLSSRGEIKQL